MKTRNQSGFTLVQAVFILVVLGMLGMVMVRLIGVQTATGIMALQQARAYQAARSGLEWGAAQILEGGADCDEIEHNIDDDGIPIEGFVVKIVSCDESEIKEGDDEYTIYIIESLATFGRYGSSDYISRKVQMKVGSYDVE